MENNQKNKVNETGNVKGTEIELEDVGKVVGGGSAHDIAQQMIQEFEQLQQYMKSKQQNNGGQQNAVQ